MSDNAINVDRVLDLAGVICDEGASDSEFAETDAYLLDDRLSCNDYLNYCWMHVALTMDSRIRRAVQQVHQQIDMGLVVPAIPVASELDVVKVETPDSAAPTFLPTALPNTMGYFSSGWPVAYLVATVIFGVGLVIGAVTHVSEPMQDAKHLSASCRVDIEPEMESVGRITGMVDCRWADESSAAINGAHVPLGRTFALGSGLMEITYDTGAKVILQGPMTYSVETNGGYLAVGKLTGKLEKKGSEVKDQGAGKVASAKISSPQPLAPSPFVITTPTATVIDLGTEFGVEVDSQGSTTSRVFRGAVKLQAFSGGGASPSSRVLRAGQSASVDCHAPGRVAMSVAPAKAAFVREIPTHVIRVLDLADVVAGGSGTSGHRNRGIDPSSGRVAGGLPLACKEFHLVGDHKYHRVEELPAVDGVFIPDGGDGPVQIDSAGHVFGGFPRTDNRTYGPVWAGNVKPHVYAPACNRLGLTDYCSAGHAMLDMLANKGITFDLDAIRRGNPGCKLLRFHTVIGNTGPRAACGAFEAADAWVFLDGQPKFSRQKIRGWKGPIPIAIPLADGDRFLTVATTDGEDGHAWDWIVFGDPQIDVEGNAEDPSESTGPRMPASPSLNRPTAGHSHGNPSSFDANADMIANVAGGAPSSVYDAWSIGYRLLSGDGEGLTGANLHLFSSDQHIACDEECPLRGWELPSLSLGAMINTRGAEYRNVNNVCFEKDILCLHPGGDGSRAVLRWTAPRKGVVKTSTIFTAIHDPITDVHVLLVHDGAVKSLFSGEINDRTVPKVNRLDAGQAAVPVSAGDYIEVLVGWGSNQNNFGASTGVFHSIAYRSQ